MANAPLSIGQCATLACLLEATAAKPGNVHRGADFDDVTFADFALSAVAIGPVFDRAGELRLGQLVLSAVQATRQFVSTNTNLGMLLLLGPLALAPRDLPWPDGVGAVLDGLTTNDARDVYEAIRLVQPGGMGHVNEADVAGPAPESLMAAMQLAADRDLVARQYTNRFKQVLDQVVPALMIGVNQDWPLQRTIVYAFLKTLAAHPDSLIVRKCGTALADRASDMAGQILAEFDPAEEAYADALAEFDFWLRSDGHRRNPGTTADLVTAGLFVLLRDGIIKGPFKFY
ncbi:MAG: triphosphoribosyl-dephospho-CoA synthase [Planctomycetes bacterium]|nr:triphosphoribosyl-dephospho-CoA synthase [Planctomycetota bacterium]